MKRFDSSISALWWWYELREVGVPIRFMQQDLTRPCVQISMQIPAPSDLWCVWITLDLIVDRLPNKYRLVIERYFASGRYVTPFRRWHLAGMWKAACRYFWRELPREMKWSKRNGIAR